MSKARGSTRQVAIEHARRTTGTVLVSGIGVFSGDGMRAFDPIRLYNIAAETSRFLERECCRFSVAENMQAINRRRDHEYRLRRLAKRAIDQGKYESARRLCQLAKDANEDWTELQAGERVMYRLREGVTQ